MVDLPFSTLELALAVGIALTGGLVRGFAGFGAGMTMVPLFTFLFGPASAIAVTMLLDGVGTAQLLPRAVRHADWRLVALLSLMTFIAAPAGLYVLFTVDAETMRRVIGAVVLTFVLLMLSGWRYQGRRRTSATLGVGALAGVLTGSTGLGGPPVVIYLLSSRDTVAQSRASIIIYYAVQTVFVLAVLGAKGVITIAVLMQCAILAPTFALAIWIGNRMFSRASETLFRRIAMLVLAAIGVTAVVG